MQPATMNAFSTDGGPQFTPHAQCHPIARSKPCVSFLARPNDAARQQPDRIMALHFEPVEYGRRDPEYCADIEVLDIYRHTRRIESRCVGIGQDHMLDSERSLQRHKGRYLTS